MNLPPFLAALELSDRNSALGFFEEIQVDAGQLLMHHTYESEALAFVVEGELEVRVAGHLVGVAGPGEWVGETALFPDGERRATVTSRTPAWLLVLPSAGYVAMRRSEHLVIPLVEQGILMHQLDRLRRLGQSLTEATKEPSRQRPGPGVFDSLAAQFGPGGPLSLSADLNVAAELRGLGLVDDEATDATAAGVAAPFQARSVPAGALLCTEGEKGDAMFVLVRGAAEVVKAKGDDGVAKLATLTPGAAFGLAALHERKPRMASVVASETSAVLRLDQEGWEQLVRDDTPVGTSFRRAMVDVLSRQLAEANRQLVEAGVARATGSFEGGMRRAAR